MTTTLTVSGETELLDGATVNAGYFRVLRHNFLSLGCAFLPGEEQPGSNGVAILGHTLWMRRFGGNVRGRRTRDCPGRPIRHRSSAYCRRARRCQVRNSSAISVRLPRTVDIYPPIALPPEALRLPGDFNYGVNRARPSRRERRRPPRGARRARASGVEADARRRTEAVPAAAAAAGRGATRARSAHGVVRGDRCRPADCLRQPREPAAGQARRAQPRSGDPDGPRRRTRHARRQRARWRACSSRPAAAAPARPSRGCSCGSLPPARRRSFRRSMRSRSTPVLLSSVSPARWLRGADRRHLPGARASDASIRATR